MCMHFTSTPTCMNFLNRFYFLTPMDYSPWSEREIWSFLKSSNTVHVLVCLYTTYVYVHYTTLQLLLSSLSFLLSLISPLSSLSPSIPLPFPLPPFPSLSLSPLSLLTVGEPLNDKAWQWYHNVVGESRCTVVDTWWQTG